MTSKKIYKLEREIKRAELDIHHYQNMNEVIRALKRFNHLEEKYMELTGRTYDPTRNVYLEEEKRGE